MDIETRDNEIRYLVVELLFVAFKEHLQVDLGKWDTNDSLERVIGADKKPERWEKFSQMMLYLHEYLDEKFGYLWGTESSYFSTCQSLLDYFHHLLAGTDLKSIIRE